MAENTNSGGRAQRMSGSKRREQIARAALVLAENGLKAVTVAGVAEAVGLVPSALYRHFSGRDEIIQAAFGLLQRKVEANIDRSLAEPSVLGGLEGLVTRQLDIIRAYPAMPRIIFSDEVLVGETPLRGAIVRLQDAVIANLAAMFARGQERGEIRSDVAAGDLAVLAIGQLLVPMYMYRLRHGEFDLAGQVKRSMRIFRQLLIGPGPAHKTAAVRATQGDKSWQGEA